MALVLTGLLETITIHLNTSTFYITFNMKKPILKTTSMNLSPFLKAGKKCPKKWIQNMGWIVSARWRFGTMSPGACTSHCRKLLWSRLASSFRNLSFFPPASRNPGHAGSCHGAGWLSSLSNILPGICLFYQQQAVIQRTKLPWNRTHVVTLCKNRSHGNDDTPQWIQIKVQTLTCALYA